MSSMRALQKLKAENNLVDSIRDQLDSSVQLRWVKAHVGVAGIEAADRAAKQASTKEQVDIHLGVPTSTFKTKLKKMVLEAWQRRWDDEEESREYTSRGEDNLVYNRSLPNTSCHKPWSLPPISEKV
ncbi:hypothetical protein AVEN_68288-1 [Araneus ventricosus]|uniref:RNase H type-1 domain-containing protein n=1 Tax=Araneus ventricosus TaxID=182803 RepID=A0A4Y2HLA6_ARAVE|nr:hypothetical protein AVEN_68288-1 [Araneus ventricosus]